jgi:hypothetical protein
MAAPRDQFTDELAKRMKAENPTVLCQGRMLQLYRANPAPNLICRAGRFIGSLESARSYLQEARLTHMGVYRMPPGYYMILNSATRIDQLNSWFATLISRSIPEEIPLIKNLHMLFRAVCGMAKTSTPEGIKEGYTDEDFEFLKQSLRERGMNPDNLRFLDMSRPDLKPTRISLREIDQYMAGLAVRFIHGRDVNVIPRPDKERPIIGIITSCRSVGESTTGTNATLFANPASVAVPTELITLIDLQPEPPPQPPPPPPPLREPKKGGKKRTKRRKTKRRYTRLVYRLRQ